MLYLIQCLIMNTLINQIKKVKLVKDVSTIDHFETAARLQLTLDRKLYNRFCEISRDCFDSDFKRGFLLRRLIKEYKDVKGAIKSNDTATMAIRLPQDVVDILNNHKTNGRYMAWLNYVLYEFIVRYEAGV